MAAAEQTRPCCLHSGQLFIACLCLRVSVRVPPSPFTRARVNMPVQIAITQRQWQACAPSLRTPSSSETPTHPPRFRPRSLSKWESVQTLTTFKLMLKNSGQTLWFPIGHREKRLKKHFSVLWKWHHFSYVLRIKSITWLISFNVLHYSSPLLFSLHLWIHLCLQSDSGVVLSGQSDKLPANNKKRWGTPRIYLSLSSSFIPL